MTKTLKALAAKMLVSDYMKPAHTKLVTKSRKEFMEELY